MLRAAILFCLVAFIIAESGTDEQETPSGSSCLPYPEGLRSLAECCNPPILFNKDLAGTCELMCSEDKKHGDDPDCPINCLFRNNGIMRRDQINRTAIEVTYDRFGLAYPGWRSITSAALDRCPIQHEKGKSFKEAFKVFETCMTEYYQQHCIEFKQPTECDKVEDFMLKCQNVHEDCNVWPKWIIKLPEFCCDHPPELFNSTLRDSLKSFCDVKIDPSNLGQMQCLSTYLLNVTGIKTGETWNFDIAMKSLKENVNDDTKWSNAIEKTMEVCKKEVEDDVKAEKSAAYTNFWFYECVKGTLADFCPHYAEGRKECRRLTKFKEACPTTVPARKVLMVNGRM